MDELEYLPDVFVPTRPLGTSISIPNLAAELELSVAAVVAGDSGTATLVLRNTGLAKIDFYTDSVLVGRVLNILREPVGSGHIAVATTATSVQLAYKQELEIPVVFETSSHHDVQRQLPPGEFLLSVRLPIYDEVALEATRVVEVSPINLTLIASEATSV